MARPSKSTETFVESHGGQLGDISIHGQESNATTRRLAVMNLARRSVEADFDLEHPDTFGRDLRADYVLANPPFNDSDWFRKDDDVRWQPSEGSRHGERAGVHQFDRPPAATRTSSTLSHQRERRDSANAGVETTDAQSKPINLDDAGTEKY